jgi:hypothetical protein
MKKIKFGIIVSVILGVVGGSYGQSTYGETEYLPTNGEDDFQSAMNLSSDIIGMVGKLSPKGKYGDDHKYESRKMLNLLDKDKLKTNLWAKMNREQRFTDHANLKLHYTLSNEKIEMQNYYNRVSQLRSNDSLVGKAWEKSPTGKRDGRYWHQLTDPEKEVMRKRYVRYHNPDIFEEEKSPNLVISESEYAIAWKIQNMNHSGIPTWNKLRNFETKNNFRKSYYSFKLARLSPPINVSEEELADAWEIAQLGRNNYTSWANLSDSRLREEFRNNYIALIEEVRGAMPEMQEDGNQMVASVNHNFKTQ